MRFMTCQMRSSLIMPVIGMQTTQTQIIEDIVGHQPVTNYRQEQSIVVIVDGTGIFMRVIQIVQMDMDV